jgi:hypothetical protein
MSALTPRRKAERIIALFREWRPVDVLPAECPAGLDEAYDEAYAVRAAKGNPLRRGQMVMTGSLVATQFPAAGDDCVVTIDGLGQAELALS